MTQEFQLKASEDIILNDIYVKKGHEFGVENFRGTQFWNVYNLNGHTITQVDTHKIQTELLHGRKVTMVDKSQAEDLFGEFKWPKFYMKPNRNLKKTFARVLDEDEHNEYIQDLKDESEIMPDKKGSFIADIHKLPLSVQPLWISWPTNRWHHSSGDWGKDLGNFRYAHSVILSKDMIEAIGGMLSGYSYYLDVVELDDRYRFILHYSGLIGSRWLFENYKGEAWNRIKK